MKNILIILVLSFSYSLVAQDLWGYANAGADAIVYVNSENGEKNMDPVLWAKIQREKKEAIAVDERRAKEAAEQEREKLKAEGREADDAEDDGMKLDFKNRHVQLLLNIFVVSTTPMAANMEGAIILSGKDDKTTPLQDFKELLGEQKGNPSISQRRLKVDGHEAFAIDTTTDVNGRNMPANCLVVPIDDNMFEFKMKMNSPTGVSETMLSRAGGTMAMTDGLTGGDNVLAIGCNTQRLASMMNGELTPQMLALKNCLLQTDIGKLTCRVSGRNAYITIMLHFYDPAVANRILAQIRQVTYVFNEQPILNQYVREIKTSVNGDQLIITGTMDIERGWSIINKFHQ